MNAWPVGKVRAK